MSDELPLYIFVANEPIQIGSVVLEADGTFKGTMPQRTYDLLAATKVPWYFALNPER